MPRQQRKRAASGFYHVVTKGNGGQVIFEDDKDKRRYLELFSDAMAKNNVIVHAYVLMDNHTHALLQDTGLSLAPLSSGMKQLDESYAGYFHAKSGRVGHVFQGRFWSEPIEKDSHYLCTTRYIHANPEVAGMCPAADFKWSSMGVYLGKGEEIPITNTQFLLGLCGGREEFVRFSASGNKWPQAFKGSLLRSHLDLGSLFRIAKQIVGDQVLEDLPTMTMRDRLPHVAALYEHAFTAPQICMVTGLGRNTVTRLIARS